MPLGVLYLFSDLVYLLMRFVLRYRSEVIETNLRHAFPEKSAREIRLLRNRYYRNFTDVFLAETLKMITISEEEMRRRFEVAGLENLQDAAATGKSVILMVGHVFNWEMGLLITNLVAPLPVETIYKKVNNAFFEQAMRAARTTFGGTVTEISASGKSIATLGKRARIFILAADQRPTQTHQRYIRPFLHRDAAFYEGGESLSRKFDLPLVFGFFEKKQRGYYRLTYMPMDVTGIDVSVPHSITDLYVRMLEENIREQPDIYLWSHKRWKI